MSKSEDSIENLLLIRCGESVKCVKNREFSIWSVYVAKPILIAEFSSSWRNDLRAQNCISVNYKIVIVAQSVIVSHFHVKISSFGRYLFPVTS